MMQSGESCVRTGIFYEKKTQGTKCHYNEYYYDGTYYRREDMMAETTIKITYIDRFDFNNEGECEIKIYKPAKEWAY